MTADKLNQTAGVSTYLLDTSCMSCLRHIKTYINIVDSWNGGSLVAVLNWTDDVGPQSKSIDVPGVVPSYLQDATLIYSIKGTDVSVTVRATDTIFDIHAVVT